MRSANWTRRLLLLVLVGAIVGLGGIASQPSAHAGDAGHGPERYRRCNSGCYPDRPCGGERGPSCGEPRPEPRPCQSCYDDQRCSDCGGRDWRDDRDDGDGYERCEGCDREEPRRDDRAPEKQPCDDCYEAPRRDRCDQKTGCDGGRAERGERRGSCDRHYRHDYRRGRDDRRHDGCDRDGRHGGGLRRLIGRIFD